MSDTSTRAHTDFTKRFVSETQDILGRIDPADIEAVVDELVATKARQGRLFFCGSGGGAGHASHAACDFRKLGGFEAYCVTDNVSELTARINDDGWDGAYAAWLQASALRAGDTLFVFSVGGGDEQRRISVNLVNAMKLTDDVGGSIVGIAGRDGGMLRRVATASIVVPVGEASNITAQAEGLQAVLWHLLVTHPRVCASTPKWESVVQGSAGQ
jgi:D-sedoheptulose 7-phosphate isomerase